MPLPGRISYPNTIPEHIGPMIILGVYFDKRIGLVNGIYTFGSALFSILMSLVLPGMFQYIGLKYTFGIFGLLFLLIGVCALAWTPLKSQTDNIERQDRFRCAKCICNLPQTGTIFKKELFKNKAYMLWSISTGLSLIGVFTVKFHLVSNEKYKLIRDRQKTHSHILFMFYVGYMYH